MSFGNDVVISSFHAVQTNVHINGSEGTIEAVTSSSGRATALTYVIPFSLLAGLTCRLHAGSKLELGVRLSSIVDCKCGSYLFLAYRSWPIAAVFADFFSLCCCKRH